jgi:hypothetical protein
MMRFLVLLLFLSASTAVAGECREASPPYGCEWFPGWVQTTPERGLTFFPEDHSQIYTLQVVPASIGDHIKTDGGAGVAVGEFEFCPFVPELNTQVEVSSLVWRYTGCIDDARNVTHLSSATKDYRQKLCSLVSCQRHP